jgi:tRNA(fMet)-specific endonuclease VapC
MAVLLDTDVLSAIMRKHPAALARSAEYLRDHPRLAFSIITRYEVLRGLSAKGAGAQAAAFDLFCSTSIVLDLTDPVVMRAADIYGRLHSEGRLIGDADILIAATALENGLRLVTNNGRHFSRIPGLSIDNWLTEQAG